MDIDFEKLADDMLGAMKDIVKSHMKEVKDLARGELKGFAERTVELTKKVAEGAIDTDQAKAILKIRQNAVEGVLLSIEGIGLLAAQQAINAAIGILMEAVKKVFPLIALLG